MGDGVELEACEIARVDFKKEKIDNINNLLCSASRILREMQIKTTNEFTNGCQHLPIRMAKIK